MDKPRAVLPFLLLVIAVALVYANSLGADFIYDDHAFVANNEEIRTFSPISKFLLSPEAFAQPANDHVYRPLASFSFAVNYALGGLDVRVYHFTNLLFHALNALLLLVLLRRIGFNEGASFAGALIFAIHPAHVEAVTWISGRGNVLFLSFFLLSFLLYMRSDSAEGTHRRVLICGTAAAYALSLLAKEMAMPLPALLLGYDLYFRRDCDRREWMRRLLVYGALGVIAVMYLLLRTYVLGKVGQVLYHGGSAYTTFLVMLKALVIYARLMFVPVGLSLSRHFQATHSLFEPPVFLSLCFILASIAVGIFTFRRSALFSFGIFWFAITILPVSNIIPVNAIVADRFLYGPSIGFCFLVAAWFTKLWGGAGRTSSPVVAASVPLVFCFMMLSINRNNEFDDPILLWQKTAQSSPTSFVAYNNLGIQYMKRGMLPEAIESLERAVEIKDDLTQAHQNLAMCYATKGDTVLAAKHYRTAISLLEEPELRVKTRLEFAEFLESKRRITQAIEQYESAVAEDPSLLKPRRRLASYYATRDADRAIEQYLEVAKRVPDDASARYMLGYLYHGKKDQENAVKFLRDTLVIDARHDSARRLLEEIEKNLDSEPNF
jgi:Tfp pilus assembly protein PilF